ncbi:hypothetical protein, partial [Aliivibrio fischeri]|uniref:hypothetical protein n=1 Tax=Aliivibrio fischeri TaxID=668 RepID=UPI001BE4C12B
ESENHFRDKCFIKHRATLIKKEPLAVKRAALSHEGCLFCAKSHSEYLIFSLDLLINGLFQHRASNE